MHYRCLHGFLINFIQWRHSHFAIFLVLDDSMTTAAACAKRLHDDALGDDDEATTRHVRVSMDSTAPDCSFLEAERDVFSPHAVDAIAVSMCVVSLLHCHG